MEIRIARSGEESVTLYEAWSCASLGPHLEMIRFDLSTCRVLARRTTSVLMNEVEYDASRLLG